MIPRKTQPADKLASLGLRPSSTEANPDAGLLADLAALADTERDADAARANFCAHPARRMGSVAEAEQAYMIAARAHLALQARVAATPAQTPTGAMEKLLHALQYYDDGRSGSFLDPSISAMRDALAVGYGLVVPKAEAPAWGLPPGDIALATEGCGHERRSVEPPGAAHGGRGHPRIKSRFGING